MLGGRPFTTAAYGQTGCLVDHPLELSDRDGSIPLCSPPPAHYGKSPLCTECALLDGNGSRLLGSLVGLRRHTLQRDNVRSRRFECMCSTEQILHATVGHHSACREHTGYAAGLQFACVCSNQVALEVIDFAVGVSDAHRFGSRIELVHPIPGHQHELPTLAAAGLAFVHGRLRRVELMSVRGKQRDHLLDQHGHIGQNDHGRGRAAEELPLPIRDAHRPGHHLPDVQGRQLVSGISDNHDIWTVVALACHVHCAEHAHTILAPEILQHFRRIRFVGGRHDRQRFQATSPHLLIDFFLECPSVVLTGRHDQPLHVVPLQGAVSLLESLEHRTHEGGPPSRVL